MRFPARGWIVAALAAMLIVLVSACGDDSDGSSGPSASATGTPELSGPRASVKMGLGPYYDYQLFRVAKDLGIADKAGIDLELSEYPEPPMERVRRGDIDVGYGCHVCAFTSLEAFPAYRNFLISNQYKGYVVVGNRGEIKVYDEYRKMYPGDLARAKREFVQNEVVGKTVAIVAKNHLSTLAGLLEQGGATPKDVEVLDFADDAKAANAFIAGDSDYYIGALPQEARLLYSDGLKDKYVAAAGQQAFGPGEEGQLFLSTFFADDEWLEENPEVAKRLVAIWYRATRYLKEQPEKVLPIVAEAVKASTGGVLDDAVTEGVMTDLNYFPTFEQAGAGFYNEDSDTYYVKSVEEQARLARENDQLPADIDPLDYDLEQQFYDQVKDDKELVDFIDAPL